MHKFHTYYGKLEMRPIRLHAAHAAYALTALAFFCPYTYAASELTQTFDIPQVDSYKVVENITKLDKTLQANESYYLEAIGTAKSEETTGIQMLGLRVFCEIPGADPQVYGTLQSTQNHEGPNAYDLGKLAIRVHYLFTAPQTAKYTCTLEAKNRAGTGGVGGHLILQPGAQTSWTSKSNIVGAKAWGIENDDSDFVWMKAPDTSTGNECTRTVDDVILPLDPPYKGPDVNVKTVCKGSVHIGTTKPGLPSKTAVYSLRSDRWFPSGTRIRNIADIELTACYNGTGSCPSYAWGRTDQKTAPSTVQTRLMIEQHNTIDDKLCDTFKSPDQFPKITAKTHHMKVYHDFTFEKSSNCNADSYFISKLYVKYLDGNPVRIEDSRYSQNILMNQ